MRRLYARDHLDQVLATFGLILFFNEVARILFGRQPLFMDVPEALSGTIEVLPGVPYPAYRLAIIAVGALVALLLWLLISRTRLGMRVRAGASDREMAAALGASVTTLQTVVFGLGALLAGLAGAMAGPILAVQSGMGEGVLILAFVVIVIGGIGSVRGALVAALLVGLVDTLGRAFLPGLLRAVIDGPQADTVGANLSQVSIYLFMAIILAWKPKGLFPAHG
jgi:branched-chain amino acid transport system permease protein